MACGRPVLTVGRGGVKEIVNGSALTVSEPSREQLTAALRRIVHDPALRSSLGARALERSKRFRLSETARGTLEVLRRVAKG
jgi:glycosyltransferase involved in cell wall biosynthesis